MRGTQFLFEAGEETPVVLTVESILLGQLGQLASGGIPAEKLRAAVRRIADSERVWQAIDYVPIATAKAPADMPAALGTATTERPTS